MNEDFFEFHEALFLGSVIDEPDTSYSYCGFTRCTIDLRAGNMSFHQCTFESCDWVGYDGKQVKGIYLFPKPKRRRRGDEELPETD